MIKSKKSASFEYQLHQQKFVGEVFGDSSDDEIMLDIFIPIYEDELNKCLEWEGDESSPLTTSQLVGETLEVFNSMKFKISRD